MTSHASQARDRPGMGDENAPAWLRVQGLSHYLEHMLFMGSEKYPDENDYDAYLTNNGGGANAYTELVKPHASSLMSAS